MTIYNVEKRDYGTSELFFGTMGGLGDTVNDPHPKLWTLLDKLDSLTWTHDEFDFKVCYEEFINKPKGVAQSMRHNLGLQWRGDTIAANSIMDVLSPFISNSALRSLWCAITKNENLHWRSYSEAVKFCFDDPLAVLMEVATMAESSYRLHAILEVMNKCQKVSNEYRCGRISVDDAYDAMFMYVACLLVLERGTFSTSFAITGAHSAVGNFVPVCNSIQRIAQDEIEVHIPTDKYAIMHELGTSRGKAAYKRNKDLLLQIFTAGYQAELAWTKFQSDVGSTFPEHSYSQADEYARFCYADIFAVYGLKTPFKEPSTNPLPYMDKFLNVGKSQIANMETESGQYMTGVLRRNDQGVKLSFPA